MQVWLDDLMDIDFTANDIRVLAAIRPNIVPSTGKFFYNTGDLADKLGYTGPNRRVQAANAMAHAVKVGLFKRLGRGQLQLNPLIVWNGDPRDAGDARYQQELDGRES
jgi:hypothetical protein